MVCLLTALKQEAAPFVRSLGNAVADRAGPCSCHRGTFRGRDTVVGVTGVGKILAAASCQAVIDRYKPEQIIYSGAAGAVSEDLSVGDLVVARDCVQYDMDLRNAGLRLGEVPGTGLRFFSSDPGMLEAAGRFDTGKFRVCFKRVVTGDIFLTPDLFTTHEAAVRELSGDAVDMEGASAGLVSQVNGVPFLLVRYITDRVRDGSLRGFPAKLKTGSLRCLELITWIIQHSGTNG